MDRQRAAADRQRAAADLRAFTEAAAADRQAAAADRQRQMAILDTLTAQIRNQALRARNRQALTDPSINGLGQRLHPLLKEQSGLGAALPGANALAQPVEGRVGQPIGAPFPTTVRRLHVLSNTQLSVLAMLFNDDFGIAPGDTLQVRRTKFQQFIVGM